VPGNIVHLDLHDPHMGHRRREVRAHQRRQMAETIMGRDVRLVRLGKGRDPYGSGSRRACGAGR
jgi:hypothetical protein